MPGYWLPNFNDEQAAVIKKMYLTNKTVKAIAEAVGSNTTYVSRHLSRQDYYRGNPKAPTPIFIRARAKYLHDKFGAPYDHIAYRLGIGRETVRRIAKADGWYENRGRNKVEDAYPLSAMQQDYEKGLPFKRLKKKYSIKQDSTLIHIIKKGQWDKSRQLMQRGVGNWQYIEFIRKLDKLEINSTDWHTYRRIANLLTRYIYGIAATLIDPEGKRSREYHIDHMFSVHDALYNKVDIRLICHPANLKMMDRIKNSKKSHRSSITLEQLKKRVRKYERTHGVFEFPAYLEDLCTKAMNIFIPYRPRKLRIRKIPRA